MAKSLNRVGVWASLRQAWKVEDIRKKLIYTFLMLVLFRLVGVIPAPGVNYAQVILEMEREKLPLLELLNMMTGSSFSNMTIMAMGISPYINSSIIMQLLTIAIPALENLQKSGKEGQKKIAKITRYVTVGLAVVQAIGLVAGLGYIKAGWFNYMLVGVSMAAGTALSMWIGERITEKGIGNGISLLIFAGIVNNLYLGVVSLAQGAFQATTVTPWLQLLSVLGLMLLMIVLVTFVDLGFRLVEVKYAKQIKGNKMYGGQISRMPLKVISVGVLPLIFAYSFMAFPGTIIQLAGGTSSGAYIWWAQNMSGASPAYLAVTALLIVGFTYFYSSISFNPKDMADNIKQQGGTILPSVRPGKPTEDHLKRINGHLTLFAALFLAVLATVPTILTVSLNVQIPFAASSLLIAVSVALETKRQIDELLKSRNYDRII